MILDEDTYLCNGCNDVTMKAVSFKDVAIIYAKGNASRVNFSFMTMKAVSFKDVAIIYAKGNASRVNFSFMTKNDAINLLNNSVLNSNGVL